MILQAPLVLNKTSCLSYSSEAADVSFELYLSSTVHSCLSSTVVGVSCSPMTCLSGQATSEEPEEPQCIIAEMHRHSSEIAGILEV